MTNNSNNVHCCHEERFASIESEIAEIQVRLDSKKEDIQEKKMDTLREI